MYTSVWNRVALLAAGLALGWNLVNYWTVPLPLKRGVALRLGLAGAGAVLVLVLLGTTSAQAAVAGALVLWLCALVAYAANAKQVSRAQVWSPMDAPERPVDSHAPPAVLLVHAGEPATYTGPEPWAEALAAEQARGQRIPHWLVRPRIYARIRATYATEGHGGLTETLLGLAGALQMALGASATVSVAPLRPNPALARLLARLTVDGIAQVVLVPVALDASEQTQMREQVGAARVREVGVHVTYTPTYEQPTLPVGVWAQRWSQLCAAQRPAPVPLDAESALTDLRSLIESAMEQPGATSAANAIKTAR